MNTEVSAPGPPCCTTLRPGMSLTTSARVRSWRAATSSAVTTLTLLATSSSGVGMRVAVMTMVGTRPVSDQAGKATYSNSAALPSARRTVRPGVMGKAPEVAPTRARGVVTSEAGRRAVSEAYRRTRIARRDAHRLTRRPVSGLSSRSLRLRRIAFPRPVKGAVAHVIRLISITVAGAAPALDESAPDFPFNRSPARGHSLRPVCVGTDTSRRAKRACGTCPPSRATHSPRAWHDRRPRCTEGWRSPGCADSHKDRTMEDFVSAPWLRRLITAVVLAGLVLLGFQVVEPFIEPLVWAAILAFVSWPLYQRLLRACRGRGTVAALLMTAAVTLAVIAPLAWLAVV